MHPAAPAQPVELLPGPPESEERDEPAAPDIPLWRPTVRERVREAWQARHLALGLARTSVPTFRGRLLGRGWLLIQPTVQVFGFGFLFGGVFHAQVPHGVPYLLFLVFGMQAFRVVQFTVLYETMATKMVRPLVRGLALPLLLIPFSALGRVLTHLAVYWAIAGALLVYYLFADGHFYLQLDVRLLIGIAGILMCIGYGLALGLFTSVIYPRARDIRYLSRYALQIWMLATPVFYSYQSLPHTYQVLAELNPLTSVIGMVQYGFIDAGVLLPWSILWSVIFLAALFLVGVWFFNHFATTWIGVYRVQNDEEDEDDDLL